MYTIHRLISRLPARYLFSWFLFFISVAGFSQPANNDCANAIAVNIPNSGFAFGTFASSTNDLTAATVQSGETFAPAILVAGQNQKSIWYKFTLPTPRSVRVSLAQPGSAITAGDAGFAVYKTNSCLPTGVQISSKLTPIGVFGSTFHPCVDPGDYLVQVSSKAAANGPVYITVELAATVAAYDNQTEAYQFGILAAPDFTKYVDYAVDCQSIEDAAEVCTSLSNYQQYNKSTWHTFTTPAYFDYVGVMISGTGSPSSYFTNSTSFEKFGYNLYAGDARTLPFSSLTLVDGCDSLSSNGYSADREVYKCTQLLPNTTYSIQIFFRQDFNNNIRLALTFDGTAPTQAPEPISSLVPASNKLGVLASSPSGITTTTTDQLGCNSRHSLHPCTPSLPATGITYNYNGLNYNLSTFFTFTLSGTSRISITGYDFNPPYRFYTTPLLMRLYKQDLTNTCTSLDTNNLVYPPFLSNIGFALDCVPPGNYTLQVSGRDTLAPLSNYYYGYLGYSNYSQALYTDLGKKFNLSINVVNRSTDNKYDLKIPGAFDTTNLVSGIMQPLVNGILYQSHTDTFGCGNTVLPSDTSCAPANKKAMYREFIVPDSGIVYLTSSNNLQNKLYGGDANALSIAQNAHSFPLRITGLNPYTTCLQYGECEGQKVCAVPGTYTYVTFGSDANIGTTAQSTFRFKVLNTVHNSPANAEDMGTLNPGVNTLTSAVDYFSCKDNAIPINGYLPCNISGDTATKAIYRQFYLSAAATISISSYSNYCGYSQGSPSSLFSGRATDGISGLTPLPSPFQCFITATNNNTCNVLNPDWYTVVSYGSGPTYQNPFQNINQAGYYGSYVGNPSQVTVSATLACPGSKYNRPYKAAIDTITHQPFLIQWGPGAGHTATIPKTDVTYTLYQENFNCSVDTPFTSHPIPNCNGSLTKVTYYVFRTTQESFVQIDTKNYWAAVYQGNARTDSALFGTSTLIQPCIQSTGYIQICKLQPGTYTLVIFATSAQNCDNVTPTIYIDQVGYSRFDHANNAYDFGLVPPDSLYHSGKTGDINPLDPNRVPSNDFIYCTTGSRQSDPTNAACSVDFNSQVYNTGVNNVFYNGTADATPNPYNIIRRNLWYTFVVDQGGYVKVKVVNRTIGKGYQYPFAVYKSNVNGLIPFTTVVSTGQVDSTLAQGLTFVARNPGYYYCPGANELSFYRDPCSSVAERYYILVENTNSYPYELPGMKPNSQVDVSILMDSVNAVQPLFDHYYQSSNMGTNLGTGTYTGATDNYSCATRDAVDPVYAYPASSCSKTLWYKFSTTVTGYVRFRAVINGQGAYNYDFSHIQLFKQIIPGDSTVNGLQILNASNPSVYDPAITGYWGQTCISPGTYYILLPGCSQVNEYVYPQIQIFEQAGDFCSAPVVATLNGAGTNVSSVIVNCHTIGTDYGEFNPTLTCPAGAITTDYKTSWFRINITGTDTLDVTTFLTENTNALPAEIKYRLMNGNCGAMQERSCVQDAQTQDTYKCLAPGSYYVQVFTPVLKNGYPVTGTIDLHLSGVNHADTCAPIPPCLANANFATQFDCSANENVTFVNYSTYGSAVNYNWNFGYNGQTSTAVSPQFNYPALATAQTYTVTLTVQNTTCSQGGTVTYTAPVTIPGRPDVHLGNDTVLCTPGTSLLLNATTWPGSVYQWQNYSTNPTFNVTSTGTYWVNVTYNGCVKRDTVVVKINAITPYLQTKYLCGNDSVALNSARGAGETYLWNNGSTNAAVFASTPGVYINTLNWNGCIIKDTFNVLAALVPFAHADTTICAPFHTFSLNAVTPGAVSYLWQNNSTSSTYTVTAPGTYWVRVFNGSCYLQDTVNVLVSAPATSFSSTAFICAGQTYTLPWGATANATGVYSDTLRNATGCDSIRRTVNLTVQAALSVTTNPVICAGQSYTLPWGTVVNTAGIYSDTIRSVSGCDSIRRTVNLTYQVPTLTNSNPVICAGSSYTLPWGTVVSTAGIYRDTIRSVFGCDSIRRTVNLTVQSSIAQTTNPIICAGQSYTLPWGAIVSTAGIYRDTLHYITGCDSVRRTVNLTVQSSIAQTTNPIICAGQSYTLPWGAIVNAAGVYRDTLHYITGCDSVRRTVNLTVQSSITQTSNPVICAGQSYTLPWGTIVNTAGVYRDTLHYVTGCDSVRRTVNLTVQSFATQTTNPIICAGQSYTLPWGTIVNTAGVYRDTLHYVTGCDSVRRTVNLTVQSFATQTTNPIICAGQSYTLPWGTIVNAAGVYRDTLHYLTGCDSIRRAVNLTVQSSITQTSNPVICAGQSYTLPWGTIVNTAGVYRDTLHYVTGCDSIRRMVNLTVQSSITQTSNPVICAGQSYTLPWGTIVNSSGTYHDTLHYVTGCDSVRRTVNLVVQAPASQTINSIICAGQSYTLPWGAIVNTAGVYRDTLHYISGCDSLRRTVNLLVQSAAQTISNAIICQGQSYTLPWGTVVSSTGTYRDTLHYHITGCDSIRRIVNLTVQAPASVTTNPVICQGTTYILPWGTIVNTSGIYRDTLHYLTGCDSVQRTVNLLVVSAATKLATSPVICSDETYTLPWGTITNVAGLYKDTIRSLSGCDSLIYSVTLTVNAVPSVSISKSNDVDCMLGIAKLEASGGVKYEWTPAGSLNNANVYNPVASPPSDTWYHVKVTSNKGCVKEDSVQVKVITGNVANGYVVPSAFTPNADGKNDCFGVQTWGFVTEFSLSVYNRWGERVFYTTDPRQCWDGKYKGVEQSTNVFVYQIKAKGFCGDIYRKGIVTLIR